MSKLKINKPKWVYSTVECMMCGNEHNAVFYLEENEYYPLLECDNCNNITEHEIIVNIKEEDSNENW